VTTPVRFRFSEFVLSPRQRLLSRSGRAVPLIPKYFDLLLLLVRQRRDAVSKDAIFAEVWSDVVVSDGALSQAIRTLRRTLGDDSREPRFIRTVSRHGYQFVWPDVIEEPDDGLVVAAPVPSDSDFSGVEGARGAPADALEPLVDRLIAATVAANSQREEARDIAERLHALGTADAMIHIRSRPRHAQAVAVMRDARWNVPGAGVVPLLRDPEALRAVLALVRLRIADVRQTVARRWASAAAGGALGGILAGVCGGIALFLSPTSTARLESSLALAAIGALAGGVGAAGVAAGLAAAEVLSRSRRSLALPACGAVSGALVAAIADAVLRAVLDGLFGLRLLHASAAIDGLVIGAAAGAGYAWATPQPPGGGIAAPRGRRRMMTLVVVGICCAAAAVALAVAGRPLVGGLVHEIARSSRDAQLVLAPLGHLIGEPGFGPITRTLLSAFEGGVFGSALAWGSTRR
jgi:DNA-binding winged helix-turn-helix (wHTH) protein